MISVNLMKKGDSVLSLTENYLSIQRKNGEVDVFKVISEPDRFYVDPLKVATIGYGDGTVEEINDEGDVKVLSF